jgi:hypothetical protein
VLASARTLAPGLAIRCIGSTGGVDLSGLVGPLLSAHATEEDNLGGLLLALDQHRDLLTGRGQLSDLLRIRIVKEDLCARLAGMAGLLILLVTTIRADLASGPRSIEKSKSRVRRKRGISGGLSRCRWSKEATQIVSSCGLKNAGWFG